MARKRTDSPPFPDGVRFVTVYVDSQPNQRTVFRLAIANCTDRLFNIIETIFARVAVTAHRDKAAELEQAMNAGLQPGDILVFERRRGLTVFRLIMGPSAQGAYALDLRVWDEGVFSFHAATLYAYPYGLAGESTNRLTVFRDYRGYWEQLVD